MEARMQFRREVLGRNVSYGIPNLLNATRDGCAEVIAVGR
jgi:hypothetical protein